MYFFNFLLSMETKMHGAVSSLQRYLGNVIPVSYHLLSFQALLLDLLPSRQNKLRPTMTANA